MAPGWEPKEESQEALGGGLGNHVSGASVLIKDMGSR